MDANEHHTRAAEKIFESAESGGPDESGPALVYATVAVAEALLAVQATLDDVRDELRSIRKLREP